MLRKSLFDFGGECQTASEIASLLQKRRGLDPAPRVACGRLASCRTGSRRRQSDSTAQQHRTRRRAGSRYHHGIAVLQARDEIIRAVKAAALAAPAEMARMVVIATVMGAVEVAETAAQPTATATLR